MSLLLAVDLREPTRELFAEACRWAERLSTTLDLLYVDPYPYAVQDPAVQSMLREEWAQIHQRYEARLRELSETGPARIRGTASVRTGRAADEIVEVGRDHQAILIATHGRQGLPHLLLGSVAERVVRRATVPVLVLPLLHQAQ